MKSKFHLKCFQIDVFWWSEFWDWKSPCNVGISCLYTLDGVTEPGGFFTFPFSDEIPLSPSSEIVVVSDWKWSPEISC